MELDDSIVWGPTPALPLKNTSFGELTSSEFLARNLVYQLISKSLKTHCQREGFLALFWWKTLNFE